MITLEQVRAAAGEAETLQDYRYSDTPFAELDVDAFSYTMALLVPLELNDNPNTPEAWAYARGSAESWAEQEG